MYSQLDETTSVLNILLRVNEENQVGPRNGNQINMANPYVLIFGLPGNHILLRKRKKMESNFIPAD